MYGLVNVYVLIIFYMVPFININSLSENLTLIQYRSKIALHRRIRKRVQSDSTLKTGVLKMMAHIYFDFVTFKSAIVSTAPFRLALWVLNANKSGSLVHLLGSLHLPGRSVWHPTMHSRQCPEWTKTSFASAKEY